jgi:hypothetical protein
MEIVDKTLIDDKVLTIEIVPSNVFFSSEDLLDGWSCSNFSATGMILQLDLIQNADTSLTYDPDLLQIIFLETSKFFAPELNTTVEEGTILNGEIPWQLPESKGLEFMKDGFSYASNVITLFVFGSYILTLLMSESFNMIWSMINCFQIIVYLPMCKIRYPQNAYVISQVLFQIVTFDVIPHEALNRMFLKFDTESKAPDHYFDYMGIDSYNFLINTGGLMYLLYLWVIGAIFGFILYKLLGTVPFLGTVILKKLYWMMFLTMLIRLLIESYLEHFVSFLINFKDLRYTEIGDIMSTIASFINCYFFVLFPFAFYWFMNRNKYRLTHPQF